MRKKLTLSKTWKECLRMWKWIDKEVQKEFQGTGVGIPTVDDLKEKWIRCYAPNYREKLKHDCFFCEFAVQNDGLMDKKTPLRKIRTCSQCPGRLINRQFRCEFVSYSWYQNPRKFYKKLVQLNAKRKAMRKAKRNAK